MAALTAGNPTLLDLAKRLDPDGKIAYIVELLSQQNDILQDMSWREGNLPTGHRTTIRTGLPVPTWRKLYGGIQPTKTTTAQITATCGMLEDISEVDAALADLDNNPAEFRASEDMGKMEAMFQEVASSLFTANEATEPEAFTGFGPMFNSLSAANGENIIADSVGPDTDATSVWIVDWCDLCFGFIPRGSKAGWQMNDLGKQLSENIDGANGRAMVYRTHYRFDAGLALRDWRKVARVQFDPDDHTATTTSGATGLLLDDMLAKALRRIINPTSGLRIYMNRDAMDVFDLQAKRNTGMAWRTIEDAQGKPVQSFRGIPVRRCDAILTNETSIT